MSNGIPAAANDLVVGGLTTLQGFSGLFAGLFAFGASKKIYCKGNKRSKWCRK